MRNLKKLVKVIMVSFTFVLFSAFAAFAQVPMQQDQQQPAAQNFSEEDIDQFVVVYEKASEIQQQNEAEMIQAIEGEDLEMERFNEILTARQNQQSAADIDASAEEMAAFNTAAEKIMAVQQEAQAEIAQIIEEELGGEKYQAIVTAYQQDPELQQKVNEKLEQNAE